jgi:antitoxin VapB
MANFDKTTEPKTARVRQNNRVQAVTNPLDFRFPNGKQEVSIRKVDEDAILSPRPADWCGFLASKHRVSDDFMCDVDDLPSQERHAL